MDNRYSDIALLINFLNGLTSPSSSSAGAMCLSPALQSGEDIVSHQLELQQILARPSDVSLVGCPQGPKKESKKEMGQPRSQHVMLASREIEIVTRREGRGGFSKVYPWNGWIQP